MMQLEPGANHMLDKQVLEASAAMFACQKSVHRIPPDARWVLSGSSQALPNAAIGTRLDFQRHIVTK
eukprot:282399-Prorocentrum_lima.AAC.1